MKSSIPVKCRKLESQRFGDTVFFSDPEFLWGLPCPFFSGIHLLSQEMGRKLFLRPLCHFGLEHFWKLQSVEGGAGLG